MITPGSKIIHFTVREPQRSRLLATPVRWGHGGLGELTFMRTYSRPKDDGSQETWQDCTLRVVEGMFTILRTHAAQNRLPWKEDRAQRQALEAAERMLAFKWTPPGRGLWMMGTQYVWERGGAALNNCAFVSTKGFSMDDQEETVEPFRFLMDSAMLGIGVGFDTRGAGAVIVQGCSGEPVTYRVPDTREGWVEVVAMTIQSILFGGPPVVADVQDVRPLGTPLRGFGGVASGPAPLVRGLHGITDVLTRLVGQPLDSVAITDVMNLIGKIVVAGNIRRTAEIGFSTPDDVAFANMKSFERHPVEVGAAPPPELLAESPEDYALYEQNQYSTSNGISAGIVEKYRDRPWSYKFGGWRWASNNSIMATVGMDYLPYNDPIASAGEPGFNWLDLARSHGRLRDPANHLDHKADGANPCVEQTLENYEMCNLVENYPSHHDDYWDFQRTLKFSFMYAKAVTLMGTHVERTNAVIIRNRRIGCSMSGVADAIIRIGRSEFFTRWCDQGYAYLGYVDKKYSDWLGVRESIKRTSEKPSGTVSLVAGVRGPGAHFPKPTGFRTIRVAIDSPVVPVLRAARYRLEPSVTDPTGTLVAYFPWIVPENELTESVVGLWEQVKIAADLQYWWADNQVSYTATFSAEEAERGEIGRVLQAFDGQLKGISFLAKRNYNYAQMPFSEAPRAEVEAYAAMLAPLDWSTDGRTHEMVDNFCDGESCTVAA